MRSIALAVALSVVGIAAPHSSYASTPLFVTSCSGDPKVAGSLPYLLRTDPEAGTAKAIQFSVDCPTANPIALTAPIRLNHPDNVAINGGARTVVIQAGTSPRPDRLFWLTKGSSLTLSNLLLQGGRNTLPDGGGAILNQGGTLLILNSSVQNNGAPRGGAIANRAGGTLTLNHVTVAGSSANLGGAIFNVGATVTVTDSTIVGNTATVGGAILNAADGTVTLTNSLVDENSVLTYGGGIANSGALTLDNTAVTSNTASKLGSGIYNACGSSLTMLNNSTVTGNNPATDQLYFECP